MAKGFMIEENISATDVNARNVDVIAEANFDGGNLISIAPKTALGDERFTGTVPATGALMGLAVAYNPAGKYIVDELGNEFAGLEVDPRAFTNLAGKTFGAFIPEAGIDVFSVSAECVDSADVASVVAGDFLEAQNGKATFKRTAKATGVTADTASFEVIKVWNLPMPSKAIGESKQKMFKVRCVQN